MIDPAAVIHENALVDPVAAVGARTRVGAFAHVLSGAVIGSDCDIGDGVLVEGGARIGDRVTVKGGVQLWRGTTLEDGVFVGPNATFSGEHSSRRGDPHAEAPTTIVRSGASIGANATVLSGTMIGEGAVVEAGTVVTRDVPPNGIVTGHPARICGYVPSQAMRPLATAERRESGETTVVRGARTLRMPVVSDPRGNLTFGEYSAHLPFAPKRYFVIYDVPSREVRGEHAHRRLHQFLVCLRGSVAVLVDDGTKAEEVVLESPEVGLYVPPMIWATQYRYSADATLLVLASDVYDANDYIRSYEEYLTLVRS